MVRYFISEPEYGRFDFDHLKWPDLGWSTGKRRRWCKRMFTSILAAGVSDDAQEAVIDGVFDRGEMDECNWVNLNRIYALVEHIVEQDGVWPDMGYAEDFSCDPAREDEVVAARQRRNAHLDPAEIEMRSRNCARIFGNA